MKRISIFFLLVLSLHVYAQDPISQYIPIDNYSGMPVITLSSFNDMITLINKNTIKSAFIKWDQKNPIQSYLLIKADGTYYGFNLKGYNTIESYKAGETGNFPNGGIFYEAKTLGITKYDVYLFYLRNAFISPEDCIKAYENGFAQKEKTTQIAVLPLEIQQALVNRLSKVLPSLSVAIQSYNRIPGRDPVPLFSLDGNTYKLSDIKNRDYDDKVLKENYSVYNNKTYGESLVFYWAMANGIDEYEDYKKLATAIRAKFLSVTDFETAKSCGFSDGPFYYNARINGFDNPVDYNLSQTFHIQTYTQFEPTKRIIDSINAIVKQSKKSFHDAAYIFLLREIPPGKSYSIGSLALYANKNFFNKNDSIKAYFQQRRASFDENDIKLFLIKNPVQDSGKWDEAGEVFIRN